MISVFVDNNAWDILYSRQVDLSAALPAHLFKLAITSEAEFEIDSIPSEELRTYIRTSIEARNIQTDTYFGFYDDSLPPDKQRVSGFGQGRFADLPELEVLAAEAHKIKPTMRPTGLYKNEADVSLAARSVHSVILTSDKRGILGQIAAKYGATVVDLSKWPEAEPLGDFIQRQAS